MSSRLYKGSPASKAAMVLDFQERNGAVYIATSAVAVAGPFSKIVALEATVIASLVTEGDGAIWNAATATSQTITAVPLPANGEIKGQITSITLTSGKVLAYRAT